MSRLNHALSLNEFLFKQRLLTIYRHLMRIIYKSHEKTELAAFAKHEFALNANVTDLDHRKYLLNTGVTRINQMLPVMGVDKRVG